MLIHWAICWLRIDTRDCQCHQVTVYAIAQLRFNDRDAYKRYQAPQVVSRRDVVSGVGRNY